MPQLAVAIAPIVSFFGTPLGGLVLLGVVYGLSSLMNSGAAQPTGAAAGPTGVEFEMSRGEDTPVDAIVGRFATPGQLVYHHTTGGSNENQYLTMVYVVGTGLHDSLETLFVDGELCTLAGSNSDQYGRVVTDFTDGGTQHMWVKFYSGALDQVADPQIIADAEDPDDWTVNHRLAGHAYVVVRVRYDEEQFGGREPQFLFGVKGLRLYDWRKDSTVAGGSGTHRWGDVATYEWTENPAVILYNYRRGIWLNDLLVFGVGALAVDNDLAKFTAAANLSDESFYYPDTGVTAPRYHVGFRLKDDMDPHTVITQLERAMGGYGATSGGVYGPVPAATGVPVMTITDDDLQLGYEREAQTRLPPTSTCTRVQGKFSDPSKTWQLSPYGIRKDAAVDAAEGGARTRPLDLPFVNIYEVAQVLAEIERRRDRYTASESIVVRPKFARLEAGDLVTRTTDLFGSIVMQVMMTEELADGSIALALRQWDNSIVPSSGDDVVPVPPSTGSGGTVPTRLTTPPDFAVTNLPLVDGTTILPAFKASWSAIVDQTVDRVVVRYYPTAAGESEAQYVSVPRGSVTSATLTGLAPNTEYTVQARLETTPVRAGLVYTTAILITSGPLTVEADLADGSVTLAKLVTDLQNIVGYLTDEGSGGVFTMIQEVRDEIERQAAAVSTFNADFVRETRLLSRVAGDAAAAVVSEQLARAAADSALASDLTEVAAQIDDAMASGLFKLEASVNAEETISTITAKVRVTNDGTYSEAAWILKASIDEFGTVSSEFAVFADRFMVIDPADPTNLGQAFVFENGVAKLNLARAGRITSADGTSMVIDFDNLELYMEA